MPPGLVDFSKWLVHKQYDLAFLIFGLSPDILFLTGNERRDQYPSVGCGMQPDFTLLLLKSRCIRIDSMADDIILEGIQKKLHVAIGLPMVSFVTKEIIYSPEIIRMGLSCYIPMRIMPDILIDDIEGMVWAQESVMVLGLKQRSLEDTSPFGGTNAFHLELSYIYP